MRSPWRWLALWRKLSWPDAFELVPTTRSRARSRCVEVDQLQLAAFAFGQRKFSSQRELGLITW